MWVKTHIFNNQTTKREKICAFTEEVGGGQLTQAQHPVLVDIDTERIGERLLSVTGYHFKISISHELLGSLCPLSFPE